MLSTPFLISLSILFVKRKAASSFMRLPIFFKICDSPLITNKKDSSNTNACFIIIVLVLQNDPLQ